MKKYNGFTLIELLVVVLIIGILAAIALPQYTKAVEKARAAEAITLLNSMHKGVDAWLLANGGFPTVQTHFIGGYESAEHAELDIDVKSALTCEEDDGSELCYSKYFTYYVHCNPGTCSISAGRYKDGEFHSWDFVLSEWKNIEGWHKECLYYGDTPAYAQSLCESLAAQGWNPSDES